MMAVTRDNLESLKGRNVRVVKSFLLGGRTIESRTEGKLIAIGETSLGTSYTPGRNRQFWITQFTLQKPDGECSVFSLDESTRVEEITN